jgi:hypothetical protein
MCPEKSWLKARDLVADMHPIKSIESQEKTCSEGDRRGVEKHRELEQK